MIVLGRSRRRVLLGAAIEIEMESGLHGIGVGSQILVADFEAVIDNGHVDALAGHMIPGVFHVEIHAGGGEVPLLGIERIVDCADQRLLLRHHAGEDGDELPCALFGERIGGIESGEGIRVGHEHPAVQQALFMAGRSGGGEFAPAGLIHADQQFSGHHTAGGGHALGAFIFRKRGQSFGRGQVALVIKDGREISGPAGPQFSHGGG